MSRFQNLFRFALITWLRIYWLIKKGSGKNLPGLGFALRLSWFDFNFRIGERWFYFNHNIAAAYCLLPAGLWNEPETHLFLHHVLSGIPKPVIFIDVGASIGEMVIDVAGYPNVTQVFAFEPNPDAAGTIQKSAELNNYSHIHVFQSAVSNLKTTIDFHASKKRPTAGHISREGESFRTINCTSLDLEFPDIIAPLIILIDVEGHELEVLKGGINLIERVQPLIIFEYNDTTRGFFELNQVSDLLGPEWKLYRLRNDGFLDTNFTNTWNCVAIADGSLFQFLKASIK